MKIVNASEVIASEELDKYLNINNLFTCTKKKHLFYSRGASFDCETSNTSIDGRKIAIMYIWQFCINDVIVYGRTWREFVDFINLMIKTYDLGEDRTIIVYVHNLAFDFQFMRKWFNWKKVFAIDKYQPIYAIMEDDTFIFKCSYMLSGMNLDRVAKSLTSHKIEKLKGDLDYQLVRHQKTKLSDEELQYCFNDVLIIQYYIDEQIEIYGKITKIPNTNTGRVRQFCKDQCLYRVADDGRINLNFKYIRVMKECTLDVKEYQMLLAAFMGGFTHSNVENTNKVIKNVVSKDFTSSYPSVMLVEQYPMSKGTEVVIKSLKHLDELCQRYCLVFNVRFNNLRAKDDANENYLSSHKCLIEGHRQLNNGRIVSADKVTTTITNVDYRVILAYYDWDSIEIGTCYKYRKARLPREFLLTILSLYRDKTRLKDVPEEQAEYQLKKGMLNSTYGMAVTNIVRAIISMSDDWMIEEPNYEESIEKYNKSFNRFLFYAWGVFITAYARRNLFTAIKELGNDYIYADTDSVKYMNPDKHLEYFKNYNETIERRMKKVMKYLDQEEDAYAPCTIKGTPKPLGVWDDDGTYKAFKTLGAKRYMYEDDSGYHLTCAGLPKKSGMDEILRQASKRKKDPFDLFTASLEVKADKTGKLTHTYIDESIHGTIPDYNGVIGEYEERSYIHLEPAPFNLSISSDYAEYIRYILNEKEAK